MSSHRLLIYWCHDRSPARLGRGDRRVALSSAARLFWCGSDLVCVRRSPWRGEAEEGSAQLEEALPSSPMSVAATARRTVWAWSSSGWIRTSGRPRLNRPGFHAVFLLAASPGGGPVGRA